jgi:hypothetical protein
MERKMARRRAASPETDANTPETAPEAPEVTQEQEEMATVTLTKDTFLYGNVAPAGEEVRVPTRIAALLNAKGLCK